MRITEFEVKHFKSLKHVTIGNLGQLNVFIGGNSSGKSNILDALFAFFNDFDGAVERSIGAMDSYFWYDGDSSQPIELNVTFTATKEDLDFLPVNIQERAKLSDINTVKIVRLIKGSNTSASWRTSEIAVNKTKLIERGELASGLLSDEINDHLNSIRNKIRNKRDRSADQLKVTPAEVEYVLEGVRPPPTDYVGIVLQGFSQKLKGAFLHITAARSVATSPTGLSPRSTIIQQTILSDLVRLGQLIGVRADEKKWIGIDKRVKNVSPSIQDLRIMGGRVTVREQGSDMFLPIECTGGGYQEIIGIIHELLKRDDGFFGIEEPELHLNPGLVRGLLEVLKDLSKTRQIIITTHSTIFVDQIDLGSTWIIKKKGQETIAEKIQEPSELRSVLFELGLRASDLFFAEGILFVEGQSDKAVLPILALKLGIDLRRPRISVIPIYGKSSGKYHLKVWTEAVTNANVPFFMVLDKGAESETKKLSKVLRAEDNLFFLEKGSIEDYYPEAMLREAIKDAYGVELTEEEAAQILTIPRTKKIDDFLRTKVQNADGWKMIVGQIVAEKMRLDDIAQDLRRIFERIATKIRVEA